MKVSAIFLIILFWACSVFAIVLGITGTEGTIQLSGRTVKGIRVESVSDGSLGSRFLRAGDWILSADLFKPWVITPQQPGSRGPNYQIQRENVSLSQGFEMINSYGSCDGSSLRKLLDKKESSNVLQLLVSRNGQLTLVSIQ